MGYHIILEVKAKVKPEFVKLPLCDILIGNLYKFVDIQDIKDIDDSYIWLIDKCNELDMRFCYKCDIDSDNVLHLRMEKKPCYYHGDLEDDYRTFIKEILVPITTYFIECVISHDDLDFPSTYYSDQELRNIRYIYVEKIPEIQYCKRKKAKEKKEIVDKIPITEDIHDSDSDTWPKDLRHWWWCIKTCKDAMQYSHKLREYYSEDEDILYIADKLEKCSELGNVKFYYEY